MLNELFLQRMKEYLQDDYNDFIASYSKANVRGLLVNNNMISCDEFEKLFDLNIKKIPYLENGYYLLEENVKLGFHPLHHAGAFYMQDPSAMSVVEAIDFPIYGRILDLCAAPGGKSIQLANKITNGFLIANEIDSTRAKALYSNIERMGLSNVVVTNNSPKDFLKDFKSTFDLILIDAPCSGEGMFRKYPESQELWSIDNVNLCQKRDYEIVDIANQLLKKDGVLVYSTCTFAMEENEEIIKYILDNYDYEQLDIKDSLKEVLKEGFIPKTYRFYPHLIEGEGQFLAILRKKSGDINSGKKARLNAKCEAFEDFKKNNLINNNLNLHLVKDNLYHHVSDLDLSSLKVLNYGVKLGEISNKRFVPNHNFYKAFPHLFYNQLNIDFNENLVAKYLHGEQIEYNIKNGFGVLKINNISLGGFKANSTKLNNHYPKGLRNF